MSRFITCNTPSTCSICRERSAACDYQVVAAVGVPADADDVVAEGNGEVDRAMLVVAFEANGLVVVLPGPAMDGVHELAGDPLTPAIGNHAVKPGKENGRIELKAHEKADGIIIDAAD